MPDSNGKKPPSPKSAEGQAEKLVQASMKRWLRLTARKHAVGAPLPNQAADAAADAIAQVLGKPNHG